MTPTELRNLAEPLALDPRPFVGRKLCQVILPIGDGDPFSEVESFRRLLIAESAEIAAELGCPVEMSAGSGLPEADCTFLVGPTSLNPAIIASGFDAAREPTIHVDRHRAIVIADGPTVSDTGGALQLLRTAFRSGKARTTLREPSTTDDILDVLSTEVWNTYPAFQLRNLDWSVIVARHEPAIRQDDASLSSLQRLFSELQDAHTWVKDRTYGGRLPYRAWIEPGEAWFTHIPVWSRAWAAGVRPGDRLLDCDCQDWWNRTSATPRTRALVTGYRWLSGEVGSSRSMKALSLFGDTLEWEERIEPSIGHDPISWHIRPSGTAYLRIRAWHYSREWVDALNEALVVMSNCPRLLVDLRGNGGGSLLAAQGFRDRFLLGHTLLGHIRFSIGGGKLADPAPITGSPPTDAPCWLKPVRFLIDRQTYSASEDAILGLGGLPHVRIVGEPSGGGSGRPRTIQLRSGIFATISTALTYDRDGHCVEANGVPVDIELPVEAHHRDPRRMPASNILDLADANWR